jgi:hypothetical protein
MTFYPYVSLFVGCAYSGHDADKRITCRDQGDRDDFARGAINQRGLGAALNGGSSGLFIVGPASGLSPGWSNLTSQTCHHPVKAGG